MNIGDNNFRTINLQNLQKINQGKKRTHTFTVDFSEYDEEFVGKFTVHYPSQMERVRMGIIRNSLLEGNQEVDDRTDNIVTAISTIEVVADEFPEWYNPFDPRIEYEMLVDIFLKYSEWVNSFRPKPRYTENSEDSAG